VRRHLLALLVALLVVAGGAGVAVANAPVRLSGAGPTSVTGTAATAVFELGGRTIRQVRYHDRSVLAYRFELRNDGSIPVTVGGLRRLDREPRLFKYLSLVDTEGRSRFDVPAGEAVTVTLNMRMQSCETLSARAGSFATEVALATTRVGFVDETVTVSFPEEVHTGSPREAFCPGATATSRPPG
jgi:hypothetical protein